MGLFALPPELLGAIVDDIEPRIDLLSLALTCTTFRDIIIPDHLDYRNIVASYSSTSLWNHLSRRQDLARNIREFGFIDAEPVAAKYISSSTNMPRPIPSAMQVSDEETDPAVWTKVFEGMTKLRKLYMFALWEVERTEPADEESHRTRESLPLAVACSHVASFDLDELHLSFHYRGHFPISEPNMIQGVERSTPQLYPGHALWSISNLTILDLANVKIDDSMYQAFCSMVTLSPSVQTLALPWFIGPSGSALLVFAQLRCPSLRSLAVARVFPSEGVTHTVGFVNAHPHIEEFSWLFFNFNGPHPSLQLPSLKRLDATSIMSYKGVLDKRPGSVDLESISISWSNPYALQRLPALNPATLLEVKIIYMKDSSMLRLLSRFLHWRAVEVLSLPRSETSPSTRQRLQRVLRGERMCSWMPFSAGELLSLFPRLRIVEFSSDQHNTVKFPTASPQSKVPSNSVRKDLLSIRARYPQLESVYGWRTDRL